DAATAAVKGGAAGARSARTLDGDRRGGYPPICAASNHPLRRRAATPPVFASACTISRRRFESGPDLQPHAAWLRPHARSWVTFAAVDGSSRQFRLGAFSVD